MSAAENNALLAFKGRRGAIFFFLFNKDVGTFTYY